MLWTIRCAFGPSFLVTTFGAWFLIWGQYLCCADSLQHQVVRKLDNDQHRSRCAWSISGCDERFRIVVAKIGGLYSMTPPPYCSTASPCTPPREMHSTCERYSPIEFYPRFPISSSMLLSKLSHFWRKREREEKEVIYQRHFYLLLVYGPVDLPGKFSSAYSISLVQHCWHW